MSLSFAVPLFLLISSFIGSVTLSIVVRNYLIKRAVLDRPNQRSSHSVPVPRGGGLAILLIALPGMIAAACVLGRPLADAGFILGVILLAYISWRDDRGGVSARLRLGIHVLAALSGSFIFAPNAMLFGGFLPLWLDRAIMIIGWAWFINLYNFMDGIDGITGVETLFIAGGVYLVASLAAILDPFAGVLAFLIAGACLGFLMLNWHPAKLFLGDVGSVPLGYIAGFMLLILAVNGYWAPALIIPLYYLADSGLTICKRAIRREAIWQAHRQHFYQKAARGLGRHDRVVNRIIMTNGILVILAVASATYPWPCLLLATIIVAILLHKMHKAARITG